MESRLYFVHIGLQERGPFTAGEIQLLYTRGGVTLSHATRMEGTSVNQTVRDLLHPIPPGETPIAQGQGMARSSGKPKRNYSID